MRTILKSNAFWIVKKRRKIGEYLDHIQSGKYSKEYQDSKCDEINALQWLEAYYWGKYATSPKKLLSIMLDKSNDLIKSRAGFIKVLYFWVYYNEIRGF